MTELPVDAALGLWGMQGARADLVARRENTVFRVENGGLATPYGFTGPDTGPGRS